MENYAVVFPVFCCFIETDVPHQTAIELQTPVCYFPNLKERKKKYPMQKRNNKKKKGVEELGRRRDEKDQTS